MGRPANAIFDMGSVLIGWEVRPPFSPHFATEAALEDFLRGPFREIYNAVHDGQGSMSECLAPMRAKYPELCHLIDIYEHRWGDFMTGVMAETVALVEELHARAVPLYGLSNWPEQVWPPGDVLPEQRDSFAFLDLFRDIWVSGQHKLRKPDPASYRSALEQFGLSPDDAVFVDDLEVNVQAANDFGLHGIHFTNVPSLRRELESVGLL